MINHIYQLVAPGAISVKYADVSFGNQVIVRPQYLAVCHADQRYFQGQREQSVLRKKLPMALIHECCGTVVYDPTGQLSIGEQVVIIPNTPPDNYDTAIYENYAKGATFLSSGYDGFMQELVSIPADRVVKCPGIAPQVAAITEFVSVAVHAVSRFEAASHPIRNRIGIWGDGSLAYVTANVLRARFPSSRIVVIGRQKNKLAQFSFVHETWLSEDLPDDFQIDHAFECCGGEGSFYAIEDVIRYINPQGTLMLMGVSEHPVSINTRMVLEKGMTLVGCSRSGRQDFTQAISMMTSPAFQRRLKVIIFEDTPVRTVSDIHRVFRNDLSTPFKTVFRWEI